MEEKITQQQKPEFQAPPKKKSGAGKKILGALLALILIGGAGYAGYYYANQQAQKDQDAKVAELQAQIDGLKSTKNTDTTKTEKTLSLSGWGVEIPLEDDSSAFAVSHDPNNEDPQSVYYVTSKLTGCLIVGKDSNEDSKQSKDATVGAISRIKSDEKIPAEGIMGDKSWAGKTYKAYWQSVAPDSTVVINSFVYHFQPPQQACGNPDSTVGKSTNIKQEKLTQEFTRLFQGLRDTVSAQN